MQKIINKVENKTRQTFLYNLIKKSFLYKIILYLLEKIHIRDKESLSKTELKKILKMENPLILK